MGKEINMNTEKIFWSLYAYIYDLMLFNPPYLQQIKKVANEISSKYRIILDAGCGTGNLEQYLLNEFLNNKQITAVDISPSMLSRASKKNISKYVEFKEINLNEKLPFKESSFDCILSINTLYSVEDPDFCLKEFFRVLKKNGKLIIVNPHSQAKIGSFFKGILKSSSLINKAFLIIVNLPLLVFNVIIKLKAGNQKYHFFDDIIWIKKLENIGFKKLKSSPIYIQGSMITAFKE